MGKRINIKSIKLNDSIDKLDIDTRPLNTLKRNGITHIRTLALMTENQVKSIRDIGSKGFTQIYVAMDADIGVPLCKTIEESKVRFKKYFDLNAYNEYAENIRNVDGDIINLFYDKESNMYVLKIDAFDSIQYTAFDNETMLIMYNWNEKRWKSSFKCGDYIIQ